MTAPLLDIVDHRCAGCGKVHPDAREVRLHDGRIVSSYSKDWLHEAEAISIIRLPNKLSRGNILGMIRDRRGKDAADRIEALVRTLWDLQVAKQRAAS